MRIDVYTWQDAYVATIGPGELYAFTHTDELNGEDSVAITTTFPLKQGYRLVWADKLNKVHEHVCQDPKGLHADGLTLYTDTALNSVCELYGDYIEDKRPYSYSYLRALQVCLGATRWECGTVDQAGTVSSGLTFYHVSAREALQSILGCGGELETTIEVDGGFVSARRIGIRQHRGESSTHRRFTYTKDLVSVSRTEHYGAITACYGYGKGEETDSGGYGRKLTFGDINGGLNYVANPDALKAYGRPDGNGGFAHVFGEYENSECEDASQLLDETTAYLAEHDEPGMTYEADVVDLVQFGRSWEGVGVGDDVQIVDREFSPELRCSGRVTKLVTDLLGGTQTVTLGNVTETIADVWAAQQQAVNSLSRRSSSWDVAANTPAAYLQQVMDGLNERFNVEGSSYCFTSFEKGTIFSSVPLDENGNPTKSGGSAMQLCSQGFRIASTTKADGSWDWRTFGTGEGFVADLITAGTIDANLINAGVLQDKAGLNYWNLVTGDAQMTAGCDNLMNGTGNFKKLTGGNWAGYGLSVQGTPTLTHAKDASCPVPESDCVTITVTKAGETQTGFCQSSYPYLRAGETYTFSCWAKSSRANTRVQAHVAWISGVGTVGNTVTTVGASWTRVVARGTVTNAGGTTSNNIGQVTIQSPAAAGDKLYVCGIKLERGNTATAWRQKATDEVTALDDSLTQADVFNRLTNGGAAQGIYLTNGKLYINGTYIATGMITDKAGTNYWDLVNSELSFAKGKLKIVAGNTAGGAGSIMRSTDSAYGGTSIRGEDNSADTEIGVYGISGSSVSSRAWLRGGGAGVIAQNGMTGVNETVSGKAVQLDADWIMLGSESVTNRKKSYFYSRDDFYRVLYDSGGVRAVARGGLVCVTLNGSRVMSGDWTVYPLGSIPNDHSNRYWPETEVAAPAVCKNQTGTGAAIIRVTTGGVMQLCRIGGTAVTSSQNYYACLTYPIQFSKH